MMQRETEARDAALMNAMIFVGTIVWETRASKRTKLASAFIQQAALKLGFLERKGDLYYLTHYGKCACNIRLRKKR